MTGEAFVRYIEANLLSKGISKEVFYRDSGITTASMSQWRSGKHTPSQKAIDKVVSFFEKHKNNGMYLAAQELPTLSAETAGHIWPEPKEKSPAPDRAGLTETQKMAWDLILSMSEAQLKAFIAGAKAILDGGQ